MGNILFRSSSRWSEATDVSLSKRSIHKAAPDPFSKGSDASLKRDWSPPSPSIASVMDMDGLLEDRKSDIAQKKVTVCES
jgi:hypothetical protein